MSRRRKTGRSPVVLYSRSASAKSFPVTCNSRHLFTVFGVDGKDAEDAGDTGDAVEADGEAEKDGETDGDPSRSGSGRRRPGERPTPTVFLRLPPGPGLSAAHASLLRAGLRGLLCLEVRRGFRSLLCRRPGDPEDSSVTGRRGSASGPGRGAPQYPCAAASSWTSGWRSSCDASGRSRGGWRQSPATTSWRRGS